MATLKFYPYKSTGETKIYLRLKIGTVSDIRQSTGLTIQDAETWKSEEQLPKNSTDSNKALRRSLTKLKLTLTKEIDTIEKSEDYSLRTIDGKWLKQIIQCETNETPMVKLDLLANYAQHFTDRLNHRTFKKYGVKHKYSEKTIAKYQNVTNHFVAFDKYRKRKTVILDIAEPWANEFLTYLTDEKKLAINTKGKYITRLKTILKSAEQDNIRVNPKYKAVASFEDETIVTFLTFEELDKIIATEMPNERMQIAKDWFIISAYTAQRISDLFRFSDKNIQNIEGGKYIVFRQYKTGLRIELPIHHYVEEILTRYKGFPPNLSANEQSNRSMLSSIIKKVCMASGIREVVRGRFNGVVGMYPKWKLISNHSGRRSFCSNFYTLPDWSIAAIMNISGHQTEKSFRQYIDIEDNTLSRQNRQRFDNMKIDSEIKKKEDKLKVV
ncbi:MAG: phage integrase SAM-like domain-containing protein [Aequorivita antarctica]